MAKTVSRRLSVAIKEQMVEVSGACFWYWNSFHSFLDSAGVDRSVYMRYPRDAYNKYQAMRSILSDLEREEKNDVLEALLSEIYRLPGAIDREKLDQDRAKRLLAEFREMVGDDPIEAALRERQTEAARQTHADNIKGARVREDRLGRLNQRFLNLAAGQGFTPHQRGFELERLFFDLVEMTELELSRPFRTPSGEQIDGHFRFEKFDYLVEVKWLSGATRQPDLSIFDGKIRGKAQSTRGLFLAAEGFDPKAIQKFTGDSPRILLMTGEDLALSLTGTVGFYDLLRAKIDAMVRHGRIDLSAREMR